MHHEVGHGGRRDRKRGLVVHWPFRLVTKSKTRLSFLQSTLFPAWNCSPSSGWILINHSFFLSPSKRHTWKVFSCFRCYAWNAERRPCIHQYHYGYSVRVFIVLVIAQTFCWLQHRSTPESRFRFRLPWWHHLMNTLKNRPWNCKKEGHGLDESHCSHTDTTRTHEMFFPGWGQNICSMTAVSRIVWTLRWV